jgi:peptidoglycan hydrolase-like protein with peptidoglycan-binding domain
MDRREPSFDFPEHQDHMQYGYDQHAPQAYAPHGYVQQHPAPHHARPHEPHPAHASAYGHPAVHQGGYPQHDPQGYQYAHQGYTPQPAYDEYGYPASEGYASQGQAAYSAVPPAPQRQRRSRVPLIAGVLVLAAFAPVAINALWMQDGPHPAPFFAGSQDPVRTVGQMSVTETAPNAVAVAPVSTQREASARPQGDPVQAVAPIAQAPAQGQSAAASAPAASVSKGDPQLASIQSMLQRLGLYDGAIDGLYGPRTRAAIESFETAQGLPTTGKPSYALMGKLGLTATVSPGDAGQPSGAQVVNAAPANIEALISQPDTPGVASDPIAQAIATQGQSAPAALPPAASAMAPVPTAAPPAVQPAMSPPVGVQTISITPPAPAASLLDPQHPRPGNPQVLYVQRLLADLAYAPGSIDGQMGPSTQEAIKRFERDRGMAQSGAISQQLMRELASTTGVPFGG